MASKIPTVIADLELQLATSLSVGGTSFTLSSATDDDGNALPAGKYCFAVDNGTSNKEYLLGQVNGTAVTSVVSVSRQGVETSGAARAHRVGAPLILTNFAALQRVVDVLNGEIDLDNSAPLAYDSEPTVTNREEIATVGYVLDAASGDVSFGAQIISNATAGETVAEGDLVYFKTSDQEWYLVNAANSGEVDGVQLGIALGAGSDGAGITGGVQISGPYTTTGLTAGSTYYATDVDGVIGTSAGTVEKIVGVALSTTKLLLIPENFKTPTADEKDAMAGTSGTPSSANKFVTEDDPDLNPDIQEFTASGTWTKPSYGSRALVELWSAGGSGGAAVAMNGSPAEASGAGSGVYSWAWFDLADLGATETVTIGAGGASVTAFSSDSHQSAIGNAGGDTSFGAHLVAKGGQGGNASSTTGADNPSGGAGGRIIDDTALGAPIEGNGSTFRLGSQSAGGGNVSSGASNPGGDCLYGGGGGGAAFGEGTGANTTGTGGTAKLEGGNGGAGASGDSGTVTATDGTAPAGGGGGASVSNTSGSGTANSGAGARGQARITTF